MLAILKINFNKKLEVLNKGQLCIYSKNTILYIYNFN